MQPERIAEVRDWLTKCRLDMRAAEHLLAGDPDLAETALFPCQQAAEKALKAFLVWRGLAFSKTHNLVTLVSRCTQAEPAFSSLEDAAVVLTPYAVAFRYPGEVTLPTVEQAEEGRQFMHEVFRFVATWLPPEALA